MITKIHNIRGVGRFRDFAANPPIELGKLNLIYSENGQGKSTLSDILRSAAEGDHTRLLGRKTVGAKDQFVKFETDEGATCFHKGSWHQPISDILIFDEVFVNENVYEGFSVRPDQREKLYPIVVGDVQQRGVKREKELVALRNEASDRLREVKSRLESKIGSVVPEPEYQHSVDDFLALEPVENVHSAIAEQAAIVGNICDAARILGGTRLREIQPLELPIGDLSQLLQKQLPSIAHDAQQALEAHVDGFSGRGMKAWISAGTAFESENEEICPYCGQSLEGLRLVEHYQAIFEDKYESFEDEVSTFSSRRLDFSSWITDLQRAHDFNVGQAHFWAGYFDDLKTPTLDTDAVEASLLKVKAEMEDLLSLKRNALLSRIELGIEANAALREWREAWNRVEVYNAAVRERNGRIYNLQQQIESGDIASAERRLASLRQRQLRHQEDISEDCDLFSKTSSEVTKLNTQLSALRKSNDDEIAEVFRRYGESLNQYLGAFGAGFSIVELKQTRRGAVLRAEYRIGLRTNGSADNGIPLTAKDNDLSKQSFRNALSEGDKRSLALAFFLAQLDEISDLSRSVVVFDDPVSSLDDNRQLYTSEVIGTVSMRANQTVVMSHRPDFLYKLYDHYGRGAKHSVPCKLFEIRFSEGLLRESEIRSEWDILAAVRSFQAENIRKVIEFTKGSHEHDANYIAMLLRPMIETHFKACYPDEFPGGWSLGLFLAAIGNPDANRVLVPLRGAVADELDVLNRYMTPSQHGGELPPQVSRGWIIPYCKRALTLIGRVQHDSSAQPAAT